jgi:hypothetical protein
VRHRLASKDQPSTGAKARTKSPKARGTDKDEEQSARFKETARELGVEESGEAFESAFNRIVPSARSSKRQA